MRKNDLGIKNDYGNTGSTASDDSTGWDHDSMRSDTNIIDTYL